jgi:hypothetical protein
MELSKSGATSESGRGNRPIGHNLQLATTSHLSAGVFVCMMVLFTLACYDVQKSSGSGGSASLLP